MPPPIATCPRIVLVSPREQENGTFGCGFDVNCVASTGRCSVKKVEEGGSADEAGIVEGDRILAVSVQRAPLVVVVVVVCACYTIVILGSGLILTLDSDHFSRASPHRRRHPQHCVSGT